jgi:hypothetical protein
MWAILLIVAILEVSAIPVPPGSPPGNITPLSRRGSIDIAGALFRKLSLTRKLSSEAGSPNLVSSHLISPLKQLSEMDDEKQSVNFPSLSYIPDSNSPGALTPLSHVSETWDDQLPSNPQLALFRLESYAATPPRKSSDVEPTTPVNIRRKWSDSGFAVSGKRFCLGRVLGEGKHGTVYFDANSPDILIKVPFSGIDIIPEVNALKAIGKFIGLHRENGYDAIVYKYTPGMTLKQLISSGRIEGCFDNFNQFREEITNAAFDALKRLNDLNVEHHDAHFENILFTVNHCRLSGEMIDFSRSRLLDPNDLEKKANALVSDELGFIGKFDDWARRNGYIRPDSNTKV